MNKKTLAVLWAVTVLLPVQTVWADAQRDIKIRTVRQMYADDVKAQRNEAIDANATLVRYGDESLKAAFAQQDRIQERDGLCGPDYSLLWQSQDPTYREQLRFDQLVDGRVRVRVDNRASVSYRLNCSGGSCRINDVFDQAGSAKRSIAEECK